MAMMATAQKPGHYTEVLRQVNELKRQLHLVGKSSLFFFIPWWIDINHQQQITHNKSNNKQKELSAAAAASLCVDACGGGQ